MKRLLVTIFVFCVLLTVPLGYFILRTYHGLAQEEEGALRYFAEALFDQMEEELDDLAAQEEARGVFEYADSSMVPAPADGGGARFPFVVGYLQNRPDGSPDVPQALNELVQGPGLMDEDRLMAANAAFNMKRSREVEAPEAAAEAPAPAPVQAKAQAPSIATQYVKKAPAKEKSLQKKSARIEEITVGQARELASKGNKNEEGWSIFSSLTRKSSPPAEEKSRGKSDRLFSFADSNEPIPEEQDVSRDTSLTGAYRYGFSEAPAAPEKPKMAEKSLPAAEPALAAAPIRRLAGPAPAAAEAEKLVSAGEVRQDDFLAQKDVADAEQSLDESPQQLRQEAAASLAPSPVPALEKNEDQGDLLAMANRPRPGRRAEEGKTSISSHADGKERPAPRKVLVEVAPLQSLFLTQDTIFVFRRIMVGSETFRQGFVIDLPRLLDYFCRNLFEGQPMAGYAGLTLAASDGGKELSSCCAGKQAAGKVFLLSRSFPKPFSFLSGSIASDSIPATGARSRLNTLLAILAAVLGLGFFALFWSARAAWEYTERRSAFVSSVTHELKTPLTNIRLYIEMLESGMAMDREREEEYLRVISSESGRLSRLIENVLEFSRLERKKRVMSLEEGELSDVLASVRDSYGPRLSMEGFAFRIKKEGIEPFPYDREAMVQVLANLVENARKFSAKSPQKEIEISVAQDARETRISVSDRGPGIPRKALSKVFRDFYRVQESAGLMAGGTGIGLALTRKLVYAMGGRVTARNNDGPGLTVTIRFPRRNSN